MRLKYLDVETFSRRTFDKRPPPSLPAACRYCRGKTVPLRGEWIPDGGHGYNLNKWAVCPECGWWASSYEYRYTEFSTGREVDPQFSTISFGMLKGLNTKGLDVPLHLLAHEIRKEPHILTGLSSRKLEELVAGVFKEVFGYSRVVLTKCTRDGGYDIVAVETENDRKVLVEVKKWSRPVGIAVIDRLLGVLVRNGVDQGIVVTTSRFSRDANRIAQGEDVANAGYRIQLRDQADLLNWLDLYWWCESGTTVREIVNHIVRHTGGSCHTGVRFF